MTKEELISFLDSQEHYKIIASSVELKWFFDHCVYPLKRNEAYAFCLSVRKKKLNEEDLKSPLGRVEMLDPTVVFANHNGETTFENFKKGIRAYECHKEAFCFNGHFLPAKAMVCYFHINPCDELKVVSDLKKYINIHEQELIDSAMRDIDRANEIANIGNDLRDVFLFGDATPTDVDHMEKRIKALNCRTAESGTSQSLYKMCKSLSKMKRLQFDNVGTKYWVDFDLDLNDDGKGLREAIVYIWRKHCTEKLGKGNFVIVETSGGYHTMVNKDIIKWNPNIFIKDFMNENVFVNTPGKTKDYIKELEYNTNAMIPCPGTYQYGHVVTVINKEDFD